MWRTTTATCAFCFIIAVQYIMSIHPKIRDMIWYGAFFYNASQKSQVKIMDNACQLWGAGADALYQFRRYFLACTHGGRDPKTKERRRKHCCMFVDFQRDAATPADRVFVYKARQRPGHFRVGDPAFYYYSKYYERPEKTIEELEAEEADLIEKQRMEAAALNAMAEGKTPFGTLAGGGKTSSSKKPIRAPLPGDDEVADNDVARPIETVAPCAPDSPSYAPARGRHGSSTGNRHRERYRERYRDRNGHRDPRPVDNRDFNRMAGLRQAAEWSRGRRFRDPQRPDPLSAAYAAHQSYQAYASQSRRGGAPPPPPPFLPGARGAPAARGPPVQQQQRWDLHNPLQAAAVLSAYEGPGQPIM